MWPPNNRGGAEPVVKAPTLDGERADRFTEAAEFIRLYYTEHKSGACPEQRIAEIRRLIAERSEGAINFHVASLYPTLYRLEDRGLIERRWVERKPGSRDEPNEPEEIEDDERGERWCRERRGPEQGRGGSERISRCARQRIDCSSVPALCHSWPNSPPPRRFATA